MINDVLRHYMAAIDALRLAALYTEDISIATSAAIAGAISDIEKIAAMDLPSDIDEQFTVSKHFIKSPLAKLATAK